MERLLQSGPVGALALLLTVSTLHAQDPAYVLMAGAGQGGPGTPVTIPVTIDNDGMNIGGWSYGVCNDAALVTPVGVDDEGSETVNGGSPAGFLNSSSGPDGWTQGVVVDLFGINTLPGGTQGFVAASADYEISPSTSGGEIAFLQFCDTLGTPPVAVVVVVNGASIVPTPARGALPRVRVGRRAEPGRRPGSPALP